MRGGSRSMAEGRTRWPHAMRATDSLGDKSRATEEALYPKAASPR